MLEASTRNGKLLTVIVLIVCVMGIAAIRLIPVQMIPDLDVRTISVVTSWAGATPQDIEKEILIEQERYLRSIPDLNRMESLAETGRATIELEFSFGVDINEALIRVSNALSQVSGYPENVDQPKLLSSSFSQNAFLFFALAPIESNPRNLNMDMLGNFIEDYIRPRMERVPGVSQVNVGNTVERQVQILIDPGKLAQRELSITDVRSAIRARNTDISAGDINDGKRRYLIRTVGRFSDLPELEELILAHRGGADIKLKDVADIRMDHFEVRGLSYVNGERAHIISVSRESGSNVIQIKEDMFQVIEEIRRELLHPNGLQMILVGDDVRYVQASIRNVVINLGLGALLATLVLFYFLRSPSATLIGLTGIPVCTIVAFFGLLLFNRTINVISLAGVAFAIGMTVDNTIVVLESIEQAKRRGLDRIEAATSGVKEVWSAVLASSATTVLVFAPILFVQEEAGQLYSDIAIAISASIIASMLFALFVVPAACAHFGFGDHYQSDNTTWQKKILSFSYWLGSSFQRRMTFLLLTVFLLLGLAWWLMPSAEYLPEGEEPKAFSTMFAPPGYNLDEMQKIADQVRAVLDHALNADPLLFDNGEIAIPSIQYYMLNIMPDRLRIISEPTRQKDIDPMMNSIVELFESFPGMRGFSGRGSIISSAQGGSRAVNLDISGPDLADLYKTGSNAFRHAKELFTNPRVDSKPPALTLNQPLVKIYPNWDRLAEVGFTAQDFGYTVAALSDGVFVDEFFMDDDKMDIFLFSDNIEQHSLLELSTLPVRTPNGNVLPLNALAELRETADSETLRRVNGLRTVTVYIIPPREIALETAVDKVRNEMVPAMQAAGEISKGVSMSISGAADQLDATRQSLSDNFIIALLLIYLLLVAIFSHWGYPLMILITVPLGIAGGLLGLVSVNGVGLLLTSLGLPAPYQPFDMITMLGFIILLGTVVNNPILIVDQTRQNLHHRTNSIEDAVNNAMKTRLRPILMSTATTVFGLAPLVFIPGAGTELYRGIGIVVMLGILCSMIITLTFLPCLLTSVLKWSRREHGV